MEAHPSPKRTSAPLINLRPNNPRSCLKQRHLKWETRANHDHHHQPPPARPARPERPVPPARQARPVGGDGGGFCLPVALSDDRGFSFLATLCGRPNGTFGWGVRRRRRRQRRQRLFPFLKVCRQRLFPSLNVCVRPTQQCFVCMSRNNKCVSGCCVRLMRLELLACFCVFSVCALVHVVCLRWVFGMCVSLRLVYVRPHVQQIDDLQMDDLQIIYRYIICK